ncbi:hypothetical protein LVW35_11965 [Pseudomonas sp. HN11]|uniref:NEL-type E3 ubiquitin ligase domain-containing protein n=1 Tax=Pseudomonas sp. HN11 TaxID=1344094 RepID=UPI001F33D55C|nr:NEL-type E3 ubiquitin ligase domain-containing protein [Pseudomonas sp. HN11]UII73842.1 hypothetical protein LVW35_11965 [Pseudomonas sp. HN11]
MTETPLPNLPAAVKPRPASKSIHHTFLKKTIPPWLTGLPAPHLSALKATPTVMPVWYKNATPSQREALHTANIASATSLAVLDKEMAGFNDIEAFAKPLLVEALKAQYKVTLDVEKTYLCLRRPLEMGTLGIEVSSFEVLKLPLLQAALHNFEASECEAGAFHLTSGFVVESAVPGEYEPLATTLTVAQFTGLCRTLDMGAQYQTYLKGYFRPADAAADQAHRHTFINAQKDALRAAAELALLKKDILPADHAMILSVINGEVHPTLGGRPVWFRDLGLMKHRLTGCVVFSICEKYRYSDDLILYVPNDPEHPLKRYTYAQMGAELKRQFTDRKSIAADGSGLNAYQRFFSRFVAYADRPDYFSQLTEAAPDTDHSRRAGKYGALLNELLRGLNPFLGFRRLPPEAPSKRVAIDNPYLGTRSLSRPGHGMWAENIDLWGYLYERHRDQLIADAASHAVPTADVDARVRSRKLAALLNIGMLVLTAFAMWVPMLGEVMLAVMAFQLLYLTFEGVVEWSEGDRRAAKAHLIEVGENLALIALTAGVGKAFGKLTAVKAEPVIEGLDPVTLPNGEVRLWKPDLIPYESDVRLSDDLKPNAFGEYEVDGKSYVRLGNKLYRKQFDPQLKKWRLQHPTDADAYQPILDHNGQGAWRHTLERPLQWDHATLLKRLGHATDGLDDAAVDSAAKVSGVDDAVLRRMHTDSLPMPSALVDTLRQFKVDRQLTDLLEQVRLGTPVPDNRYNYTLPEVISMPRWPRGRVIDVFDDATFAGPSTRYGEASTPAKPVIRIARGDISSGKLAQRVLANLEEGEIISLLGSQGARVAAQREAVFRRQLADHLTANNTSLFDSMLVGERLSTPQTTGTQALQRVFPSLPTEAAYEVLTEATPAEQVQMARPATPPAALLLKARVKARLARLNRALAGLYLPNAASSDSYCLALHALEKLPSWPPDMRLEVRQGNVRGRLLDSIGSESAEEVKYLVKNTHGQFGSQQFQAFDQQGNALNSVPIQGDNFFASIMHALPDHARTRLGVPQVEQTAQLQSLVSDYATANRELMMQALVPEWKPSRFKTPTRMRDGQVGYPLSGDGSGAQDLADQALAGRVRDVYSNLTDSQALEFVRMRRLAGSTDQQIYHLLENRGREFEGLRSALATWTRGDPSPPGWSPLPRRQNFMDRIIATWRAGMNRDLDLTEGNGFLDLWGAGPLPAMAADFSHVRALSIGSSQINDAALWQAFSHLRGLRVSVASADMPALAGELAGWNPITELHLDLPRGADASAALTQALQGMTQLESLSLAGRPPVLDYSVFTRLRTLRLSGGEGTWPTGIETLDRLESVNLVGLELRSLPDALFSGHEALWRRLGVNWGALERQSFMRAFDYVHENPAHLVDEAAMVEGYCGARLQEMLPQSDLWPATRAVAVLARQGLAGRAMLEAVEALQDEYRTLDTTLQQWESREGVLVEGEQMSLSARRQLADRIRTCWRNALAARYAPDEPVAGPFRAPEQPADQTLSLAGWGEPGNLPVLGDIVFPHIRRLDLSGARLTVTQLEAFLGRFPQLNELDLRGNRLTELPSSIEAVGQLAELNLSDNMLTITAATQARLNRLTSLQRLDLSGNRLGSLDVSSLRDLVSLNVGSTQISAWPEGALTLPRLGFLDMSASAITDIPDAALTGHEVLLAGTSLRGCRLSPEGMAKVQAFARSTEPGTPYASMFGRPLGIDRAVLAEGRTGGDPMFFPVEVSERPDLLLPLPLTAESARTSLTSAERLQHLDPQLSVDQAGTRIDAWLAQDAGAAQIEKALERWEAQYNQLIQRFNSWIDVPAVRNRNEWVNATDRRRAADRLLACWRETLHEVPLHERASSHYQVNLSGLILGDLPDLSVTFSHVRALDLSGVRLTTESQQFLSAFPRLNSLNLSGNRLGVLPENVTNLNELTHLMLNDNALVDSETLQNRLRSLPRLQTLELGRNNLSTFDMSGLDHLQRLDLSDNRLEQWPEGVLEAPALTTLDLRSNRIETIPSNALEPEHAALMEGIDLSDNLLTHQECVRLSEYLSDTGRGLGFTAEEIDRVLAGYGDVLSEEEGADAHPEQESAQQQKDRWFNDVAADSEKHRIWDSLMDEDSTGDFAYILSQLRHTRDFTQSRARLTARVWAVLEGAYADEALRERLMAIAQASRHTVTCGDGRILLFNALEVEVYEFNALKGIEPTQRGHVILRLSRSLFRLAQLETIAGERIRLNPHLDPAEIRLNYRIELASRLGLPPQPESMIYRNLSGLRQTDLDAAYAQVLQQEQTPAFIEQLNARPYWKEYLQQRYPDEFAEVQKTLDGKVEDLDEEFCEITPAYLERYNVLFRAYEDELKALMRRLSEQEVATLGD